MSYEKYINNPAIEREILNSKVLKIYPYGSRVYGTHTKESDSDFIVIIDHEDDELQYNLEVSDSDMNIYSEGFFIKGIENHRIDFLECIFQNSNDEYLKYFKLNKNTLRMSISAVSSNSYSKAKKLFNNGEYERGKKSLFHSIRILGFGVQIAIYGRIVSYSHMNNMNKDIFNINSTDWNDFDKKYRDTFKIMKKVFKSVSPLDKELNNN